MVDCSKTLGLDVVFKIKKYVFQMTVATIMDTFWELYFIEFGNNNKQPSSVKHWSEEVVFPRHWQRQEADGQRHFKLIFL